MSRALERRFEGNGNCWIADGKTRGWKVECSNCGLFKTVTHHYGKGLAPKGLIIRFQRDGWQLANNPKDDLCQKCKRRQVLPDAKVAQSKQIIAEALTPMVPVNGVRLHFNELKIAAKSLQPEQTKELIALLRDQLPKREPKQRPVKPVPEKDADYQAWLAQQK